MEVLRNHVRVLVDRLTRSVGVVVRDEITIDLEPKSLGDPN